MIRKKQEIIGFGFDPGESAHHFAVILPDKEDMSVIIEERFDWKNSDSSKQQKKSSIKAYIKFYGWQRIAEATKMQFNKRLRISGYKSSSWNTTKETILAPHFGRELTLLAWAIEDIDENFIPNALANWIGLEPEERWWLYTTINATFISADAGKDKGWRKAIKIAFSENPVPEIPNERFAEEPEQIDVEHLKKKISPKMKEIVTIKKKSHSKKKLPKQLTLFQDD